MLNSTFIFLVKVKIVGPYLPPDNTIIEDYQITNELSIITEWEQRVTGLNADPSPNSALLSFAKITETKEAYSIILRIHSDNPSSKGAFNQAERIMENLISILTICIQGNRYYYKIEAVKMQPTLDFPNPYESAPSEEFFAMSYGKKPMFQSQMDYIATTGKVLQTDTLIPKVLKSFAKALKAEIEEGISDEKSILAYYKCIELISQKEIKLDSASDKQKKEYERLVLDIKTDLSKENIFAEKVISILRKADQRIREIENSIISRNIETIAKKIGFNDEGIRILKHVIRIRNKAIVHAEADIKIIASGFDLVHFRECAKAFIKLYLSYKHKISFSEIDKLQQQKEISNIYRITYQNSILREKAKRS